MLRNISAFTRVLRTGNVALLIPGHSHFDLRVPDQRCTHSASKTRVNALLALHRVRHTIPSTDVCGYGSRVALALLACPG
jgi:hypothetical protein